MSTTEDAIVFSASHPDMVSAMRKSIAETLSFCIAERGSVRERVGLSAHVHFLPRISAGDPSAEITAPNNIESVIVHVLPSSTHIISSQPGRSDQITISHEGLPLRTEPGEQAALSAALKAVRLASYYLLRVQVEGPATPVRPFPDVPPHIRPPNHDKKAWLTSEADRMLHQASSENWSAVRRATDRASHAACVLAARRMLADMTDPIGVRMPSPLGPPAFTIGDAEPIELQYLVENVLPMVEISALEGSASSYRLQGTIFPHIVEVDPSAISPVDLLRLVKDMPDEIRESH